MDNKEKLLNLIEDLYYSNVYSAKINESLAQGLDIEYIKKSAKEYLKLTETESALLIEEIIADGSAYYLKKNKIYQIKPVIELYDKKR